MRYQPDIIVDLWPTSRWTREELARFKQELSECGRVSGQISAGIRGMGLQIGLAFAAGAIAAGFFNKLGSDVYEGLRTRLERLMIKDAGENIAGPRRKDYCWFTYRDQKPKEIKVYFACSYSSERELDDFLTAIGPVNQALKDLLDLNCFPLDLETNYDFHLEYKPRPNPIWSIRVRRWEAGVNEHLLRNEFLKTRIQTRTFTVVELQYADWD